MSKWKSISMAIVRAIVYILFGVSLPTDTPVCDHVDESEVQDA